MQNANWKKQLPMLATYSRIFFTPFIVGILYTDWAFAGWIAAGLFIIGSLTDWLDGYLARKYQVESAIGKFMDPIADKILVLGPLTVLLQMGRVDAIMVFLLLGRDIFIGGIRSVAAIDNVIIAAKPFGKWKTALQMLSLPGLLIYSFNDWPLHQWGYYGMWISVVLSLVSGAEYTIGYYRARTPNQ